MYNTTFCLNSQSLAVFCTFFPVTFTQLIHTGGCLPQNIEIFRLAFHLHVFVYSELNACV